MKPRVVLIGRVTPSGLRVDESYFHIGRRVMDRARWLQVRALSASSDPETRRSVSVTDSNMPTRDARLLSKRLSHTSPSGGRVEHPDPLDGLTAKRRKRA